MMTTVMMIEISRLCRLVRGAPRIAKHSTVNAIKLDNGGINLSALQALDAAVDQDQERPAPCLDDLAIFGKRSDTLVRIAAIVDEDADELPIGAPLANVEREAALDREEAARLNNVDDEIRLHLRGPIAQRAQPGRRQIGAHAEDQHGHHERGRHEWPEDAPRRHAGRVHHDDFRIRIEPVERVADRNNEGERRDHQHQHGNQQAGDADEGQNGLTLARHQVDFAQRVRQPDDCREADQDQQERAKGRAKNVAVKRAHLPAVNPESRKRSVPRRTAPDRYRESMARPGQRPRKLPGNRLWESRF